MGVSRRGLTLLEVMVAMQLMALVLLGFLDTFIQSRRITEGSVMQMAAVTVVAGLVEQMKMLDYDISMPATQTDSEQADHDAFPGTVAKAVPYIRVRLNQDQATWLLCVNNIDSSTFTAPTEAPASTSTLDQAKKNTLGPLALSSVPGAKSQALKLDLWVWVDALTGNDVAEAKCVTLVYAYEFNDGTRVRTVIKREVFVRTPFGARRLN
jgi:prepilin-type N-terminal cleavage/methylation domain-containing protein